MLNKLRQEKLLPLLGQSGTTHQRFWSPLELVDAWKLPVVDAYSTALVPQPADWYVCHRLTA